MRVPPIGDEDNLLNVNGDVPSEIARRNGIGLMDEFSLEFTSLYDQSNKGSPLRRYNHKNMAAQNLGDYDHQGERCDAILKHYLLLEMIVL